MSDEKISVGELERARRAMTPGCWKYNAENPRSIEIYGCDDARFDDRRDAAGVVAEHNAMPALLEVVKAAMAWREQRHQNLRDAVLRSEAEIEAESVEVRRARVRRTADLAMAIETALSKFTP